MQKLSMGLFGQEYGDFEGDGAIWGLPGRIAL